MDRWMGWTQTDRGKGRVLVAEDNLTNQQVAVALLRRLGYSADAVNNGVEALVALRANSYDLVFMDIEMPEMNGIEATRAIRASAGKGIDPKVPIIAMTAHAMQGRVPLYVAAGMDDYVEKPVSTAALVAVLEKWAKGAGAADEGESSNSPNLPVGHPGSNVFDAEVLWVRVMGNSSLAKTIVQAFLSQLSTQVETVEAALAKGDLDRVSRTGHTQRGGASTVGAKDLAGAAGAVEEAAKSGDRGAVERSLTAWRTACAQTGDAMRAWLERLGAGPAP